MEGRWNNCNIWGSHLSQIIHSCFRPNVDICVYRDDEDEDIYHGNAAGLPSLQNYKVIDIQYDAYSYTFFIEVK